MITGNNLLDGLPASELQQLRPHLELVPLEPKRFFFPARQALANVYFPRGGLVSLMIQVAGGRSVQAAAVGCDGMVGMSLILEANDPPFDFVCLVRGSAFRMAADRFVQYTGECDALRTRMLRYAHALFNETVRTAACNGLHSVEQRLARCLLLYCYRLKTTIFPVTQDALGHMLGVTRTFVTQSVASLEADGFIRHYRGMMRLIDEPGLQRLACEDYQAIRTHYARLFS